MRIVVVGGGISGLATAYAIQRAAAEKGATPEVVLVEASPRLGGNIRTELVDGFVIDGGPDSFVLTKPDAESLCKEVGLESSFLTTRPETRSVYVLSKGRLEALPEGMVLGVPTKLSPIVKTPLLSWAGKLALAWRLTPFGKPPPAPADADVSLFEFLRDQLGTEMVEMVLEPLLGGIYAGDTRALSLGATFPQLVAMARQHGSLTRAALASARAPKRPGSDRGMFLSLRGGMGELVDALVARLGSTDVRLGAAVAEIARGDAGKLVVKLEGGEELVADRVVLATPTYAASRVTERLDPELASKLAEVPYVSTATVFMAFRREAIAHPLDATGFIVPRTQKKAVMASTWVTSKWPDRGPEGHVLLRAFMGGAGDEARVALSDDELVATALEEMRGVMGIEGEPIFSRIFRYQRSSPQPVVGHSARVAKIRERLATIPGLSVVGSAYDGVGIPDCVRQAREIARGIFA